jgi:hypothetical protein
MISNQHSVNCLFHQYMQYSDWIIILRNSLRTICVTNDYGYVKKGKRTNNDLQNTTQKTKDRTTRTPLKSG